FKKIGCKKTYYHMMNKPTNKQSESSEKNDCSKGRCTPFFGCRKIQGVVQQITSLKVLLLSFEQTFSYESESLLSLFVAFHWHPPKTV
ncbi:MAG: hypothetical protein ABIN25_11420, partial [Ginsengibacter sp.]